MGKVNVVLPNGRIIAVDEAEAKAAGGLLERESTESRLDTLEQQEKERYRDNPEEKAKAFAEGLASSVTLGAYDVIRSDSKDVRERAEVLSDYRAGGEAVGALVPFLSGPVGAIGRLTPIGATTRLGEAIATRAGLTGAKRIAAIGGTEGALQSLGSEVARAQISGDPLSVESVIAAVGRGALFGAGAGQVGGTIMGAGERAAVAREVGEASDFIKELRGTQQGLKDALSGLADLAKENTALAKQARAVSAAEDAAERAMARDKVLLEKFDSLESKQTQSMATEQYEVGYRAMLSEVKAASKAIRPAGKKSLSRLLETSVGADDIMRQYDAPAFAKDAAAKELNKLQRAVKEGNFEVATAAHNEHVRIVNELLGGAETIVPAAVDDVGAISRKASDALDKLPRTLKDFSNMHADSVAEIANALDDAIKAGVPEASEALKRFGVLAERAGLVVRPESVVADLHAGLKAATKLSKNPAAALIKTSGASLDNLDIPIQFGSYKTRVKLPSDIADVAKAVKDDPGLAAMVINTKLWFTSRIAGMLIRGRPVGELLRVMGPSTERLRVTLSDQLDDDGDMQEITRRRIDEVQRAAVSARDVGFQVASPFSAGHPDFAYGLANSLAGPYEYLAQRAPKDPGTDKYMGRSEYQFSEGQIEEFAARYEAVKNPFDAMERILAGDVDPAASEALWATWPGMMQEAAQVMLENLPALRESLSYENVLGYSAAFQVPLDDLLSAENVSYLQTPPQNAPVSGSAPNSSPPNPGGRPPAVGTSNTGNTGGTRTQQLQQ